MDLDEVLDRYTMPAFNQLCDDLDALWSALPSAADLDAVAEEQKIKEWTSGKSCETR